MKMYVKLDWLTMTAPYDMIKLSAPQTPQEADYRMARFLRSYTPLEVKDVLPIERNEPHYHYHYTFSQGWQLSLSARQSQGVRLVASGGVLPVEQSAQRLIYEDLRHYGWRVTRCDIAIDVMDSGSSIEGQWFDGLAEQSFKRKYKTDLILNPNGDTIAVGSRKSDKYFRLYDKAKEQKLDIDWLRYELEIKYRTARNLAVDYNSVLRGGASTMLAMLDYIPNHIRSGLVTIAGDVGAFKGAAPRTRGNRELWLMTQIIPALQRTKQEDPDLFNRFLDELISVVK